MAGFKRLLTQAITDNLHAWRRDRSRLLAHARRKFFDAKETDGRRAAGMLEMVRQLYAVEDQAKALDHDARRALRQEKAVPVLAAIKAWLGAEMQLVLPRSPMAQAITYTLNQWDALCRYTELGYLNIETTPPSGR